MAKKKIKRKLNNDGNLFADGGKVGAVAGAVTDIAKTGLSNAQIADTSGIESEIDKARSYVVQANDNDALMSEWDAFTPMKSIDWRDIRGGSTGQRIGNTIGATASGASSGFTVGGPVGAVVGGVIGLGSAIGGWFGGNRKAKNKASSLNKQINIANSRNLLALSNRADTIDTQNDLTKLANYSAYGGPITMRYTGVMSPFGNTFEDGGIFIKPENRGKFTALKERTGKSSTWYKEHGTPAQKKMATFALNAAKWKHADGGELHTHGGDFTNGLTYIDNGGSHEANPFEGVQMGIDPQGVPNLVEEGEVIFNDYVFSNRMKVPKAIRQKYKLRDNITFAEAAKKLGKESEDRPNDPISKRGLESFMSALAESQEEVRIKNEDRRMNRYAKGGKLGNLFDGTGNKSNRLNSYSNFVPLTDDSFYTPEYMNFWNWYNTNQNTPEGQAWLNRINSGEFGPIGGNTFAPQDIIRLSHDYKQGPVHNAFAAAAKQYNIENPKEDPYTTYTKRWIREKGADGEWRTQQITDEEWNSAPAGRTYLMRNTNLKEGNTVTSDRGDKDIYYDVIPEELPEELTGDVTEVKGIRQNPLRYAPIIGSGIAVLNDIFGGNDPDYSNADMFASVIRNANRPVGTRPIGEYLAYKPLDRMFYINQLNRNTAAGRRAIQNTSGGNRATALAGILAEDYNYGENLGQLARQAEEYNQALKEKVTGFNRQTNMFNSEQGTKVDMFNSELLGKQASLYGQLANMRQRILEGNRAEKSANLTNFIQGLGDLGRELTDRDTLRWLADIGALPYNTRGQYTGGNNTAAPKKSKSSKSKKNKKKGYTV